MRPRMFPSLARPVVFAHRGFSHVAPENTMSAFKACIDHGVRAIEIDIHLCASGDLVVIHDHTVKRVSGEDGVVEDMSIKDLKQLEVGSWFSEEFQGERIPLLEEVFEAYGDSFCFNIEMKSREKRDFGLAEKTCRLVEHYGLSDRCIVSSFNPLQVRYVEKHSRTDISTAVIFADKPDVPRYLRRGMGRFLTTGCILQVDHRQVTPKWFRRFHDRKRYHVIPWTVDDPGRIRELLSLGVDGIVSNNPKAAMEIARDC